MSPDTQNALWLAGRALLGAIFVIAGIRHGFSFAPLVQAIALRGLPAPGVVLVSGMVLQIVAGAALVLGLHPMWAAAALIVFTLAASLIFLNFWSMTGLERNNAINAWSANIGLIGGLLMVAAR
jgi:putative oxidoreductase